MNINSLSGAGASLPSSPVAPTARKSSTSELTTDARFLPSEEPKVNNSSETEEQIRQAVQEIQKTVDNLAQNLRFSIDEDTGKTVIKVIDADTEEIIRQIPTEEAVEIARTLDKVQGLLFNSKA